MQQNNPDTAWHMDKKVNVGHLLTTIIIAITFFSYINAQDKRINANTLNIKALKEQRKEDVSRVEKKLDKIDVKLDKILSK
jgi:hypothetical protein